MARRAVLWIAFAVVHVGLIWLDAATAHRASWDVDQLYRFWSRLALGGGLIPGLDATWVYPILAWIPILLAGALANTVDFTIAWAIVVTAADAAAFALLVGRGRSRGRNAAAWFWLASMVALGMVGMFRLDGFTIPLAIAGSLWLVRRPWLASALLSIATWIKVWPAALLAAAVIAVRRRLAVLGAAVVVSLVAVAVVLAGGGARFLFGFVGDQAERGLQLEAVVSTAYVLMAAAGVRGARIYYEPDIITFQVTGPEIDTVIAVMTPVLVLGMMAIAALGAWKAWRGAGFAALFPSLALALVLGFVVLNKVGSPQYMAWLVPPIVMGLVLDRRRWIPVAALAVVILALTQAIFPVWYPWLYSADPWAVALLAVRNGLLVVLFAWSVVRVARVRARVGAASLDRGRAPA